MGFVAVPGSSGLFYPERVLTSWSASTGHTISATGEKVAWIGRVWHNARTGSKNLNKLWVKFGTVVKAGGSGLTLSIQDVHATTGPLIRPDETQDETFAIANGNASFVTNGYLEAALSSSRSVAYNQLLSAVIEFDSSGRLGSDSAILSTVGPGLNLSQHQSQMLRKTGGSWATVSSPPSILLGFDDGSYGKLGSDGIPYSNFAFSSGFRQNSTPDEYAIKFQVPWRCKVDGGWWALWLGENLDIVLYQGTTQLAARSFDLNQAASLSARNEVFGFDSEITLETGTDYYLSLRPSGTSADSFIYFFDQDLAAKWEPWGGSTNVSYTTRTDLGSWAAATTTRRIPGGVRISAIDIPSGGGGKLVGHSGLAA